MKISLYHLSSFNGGSRHAALTDGSESNPDDFDPALLARLTYQEYTYCAQAKPLDVWLCDTHGIC